VAVTAKVPAALPAEYRPLEEIVPPVADQVTLVFELPVTEAENCCVAPVSTAADVGAIVTVTTGGAGNEVMVTVA
jgi:hypothetical protein